MVTKLKTEENHHIVNFDREKFDNEKGDTRKCFKNVLGMKSERKISNKQFNSKYFMRILNCDDA